MWLSDRSSPATKFELAFFCLATLAGCEGPAGSATVSATFFEDDHCKPGTARNLRHYQFDAGYLATERFGGVLAVIIQKHRVDVEETDGLVIRFSLEKLLDDGTVVVDRDRIVRADPTQEVVIRTSTSPDDANAALSLFGTCPEFPTHYASRGVFTLNKLTLAADPMDTGSGEAIGGTLTATLSRANERDPVGTVDADFDFFPPRRPLTDFK
jgi:hypothetical protein